MRQFVSRLAVAVTIACVHPSPAYDPEDLLAEAGFVHRLAKALLRDADLAHDVAQDALVAAMQRAAPPRSWRGWLDTVTRRLAYKAQLARRNRARREAIAARGEADESPDSTSERLRLYERLTRTVLALPEPYRTVVTRRFLDGMSPREIARRTGVTSEVVRQQVHRGLLMLRQHLDVGFGDRTAWMGAFVAADLASNPAPPLALTAFMTMKFSAAITAVLALVCAWWMWPHAAAPDSPAVTAAVAPPVGAGGSAAAASSTVTPQSIVRDAVTPLPAPACEVYVVDVTGAPILAAEVSCWSTAGTITTAATDDRGLVAFLGADGSGGILVRAAGWQSRVQTLPERLGRHVVVMPTGSTVSGLLMIDGSPAPSGVRLRLHSARLPGPDMPSPLADRLQWEGTSAASTSPNGRFEFLGLDADWQGSLALPNELCLLPEAGGTADEPRRITLTGPRRNLIVATTRLPVVAGRVQWADTGVAVANAQLALHCDFAGGIATPSLLAASDRDGLFAVGLLPSDDALFVQWTDPSDRPLLRRVQLQVTAEGADAPVSLTLDAADANTATAIIVTLRRTTVTHFLALGPAGKPVAGARVLAAAISNPTGADGRGTFSGRPGDAHLVGAAGHRVGPPEGSSGAGTAEDPLVLSLAAGNEVRFRVTTADGKAAPAHDVIVRSQRHLFAGGRFAGELDRLLGGPEVTSAAASELAADGLQQLSDFECRGRTDGDGLLVLRSLEPGTECVAVVDSPLGGELIEHSFATPPFGTAVTVDLHITGTARQVAGVVLDELDRPIAKARLELRGSGRRDRASVLSAADGSFRFDLVYVAGALQLAARAEGHVPYLGPAHATSPGEASNVIRMPVGRTVTVRVVDDTDAIVPVLPRRLGVDSDCDRLGPGEVRFRNLPPQPVDFACTLGGIEFRLQHDTAQAIAQLRVPRPGRVVFAGTTAWPTPASATTEFWVVVTRLDAATRAVSMLAADARSEPVLLLPGRYRFEMFERDVGAADGEATQRTLGLCGEAVVAAGAEEKVALR